MNNNNNKNNNNNNNSSNNSNNSNNNDQMPAHADSEQKIALILSVCLHRSLICLFRTA